MAISVIMPALEMAQETGKVISWKKKEGERVTKGEALLEIETDKAVVEIEATGDGILAGVKAPEGAVVPVGQTIAWLVQPGEQPPKETPVPQSGRHGGSAVGEPARPVAGAAAPGPEAPRAHRQRGRALGRRTQFHRKRGVWPKNLTSTCSACAGQARAARSSLRISKRQLRAATQAAAAAAHGCGSIRRRQDRKRPA